MIPPGKIVSPEARREQVRQPVAVVETHLGQDLAVFFVGEDAMSLGADLGNHAVLAPGETAITRHFLHAVIERFVEKGNADRHQSGKQRGQARFYYDLQRVGLEFGRISDRGAGPAPSRADCAGWRKRIRRRRAPARLRSRQP